MDLSTLMPQQRDIVTTLDRPLFVSAGAGSGKTFTLTRRILWALSPESGPFIDSLDQVLAITFTNDAAAEIRERVRAALIAEGMDREALAVDDAWISTIHGMCSRILRAHALELGIDPEFGVLTDTDELMGRAVDTVLADVLGPSAAGDGGEGPDAGTKEGPSAVVAPADQPAGLSELLSWYELSAEGGFGRQVSVRQLVRRLLELAATARHGFDDLHMHTGSIDFTGLADAYQSLAENGAGKGAEVARRALAAIEAFQDGPATREALTACLLACDMPRASKGFPKESVAWLKAEAADAFINAYLAVGAPALRALMDLARRVFEAYRGLKDERSVLDNDDLLRLAYEALRDHPAIRAAYEGRFKMVMIDEFQDTAQQQVDLIGFLTGEGDRALCTVGDAQQSIYRFRGAEVEVFRRQQRAIESVGAPAAPEGGAPASGDAPAAGRVVKLVKNFRSHAEVLDYVARVFDDAEGGIMPGFLDLMPHDGRADGLVAREASRRQALLVVGGTVDEREAAKAAAIARRFRELADAGQPAGGMVILLGAMTRADVYARAVRDQGLDCVIAGGSVFAGTVEARAVRALVRALANPMDADGGLVPLLQSPLFALGAQEFLALCTSVDPETGETRRRNVDAGLMSDEDAPGLGDLPLLARARTVLRGALARVGRDPLAEIARDVVNGGGWLVRLAALGAEGKAAAANVLKALDAVAEAEAQVGRNPRAVSLAYDRFLAGKEAPGALNEEGGDAVRIMTVHASKGLEFPVVAVSGCFSIRKGADRLQSGVAEDGTVELAALPATFSSVRLADGTFVSGADVKKRFDKFLGGASPWLTPDLVDDVCATGSAAEAWLTLRDEDDRLALEERARLLYVAMTRAREVCILAMDAKVGTGKGNPVTLDAACDLTGAVLGRILPSGADGAPRLDADRLAFDTAQPGDYGLIALAGFGFGGETYGANAAVTEDGSLELWDQRAEDPREDQAGADGGARPAPAPGAVAPKATAGSAGDAMPETVPFTLVEPAHVDAHVVPAAAPVRDAYSYSSIAAALHEEGEDHVAASGAADSPVDEPEAPAVPSGSLAAEGDPTALGSAFHAAAQWLVEMGARSVPASRVDALARLWRVTPAQRARLDAALARWEGSRIRAEALAWPLVRAEAPFFTLGSPELSERFGAYAQGAIDLLCTDPADPSRALVIDYKTGGSPDETPERLREKHELQARVYADVLHRAGFARVELRFVRVEVPDPQDPAQPQVVSYEL